MLKVPIGSRPNISSHCSIKKYILFSELSSDLQHQAIGYDVILRTTLN